MNKLTIRVWDLSNIIILCLLIALPVNVFALENSINPLVPTETQNNVSFYQIQNVNETSSLATLQSPMLETFLIPSTSPELPDTTE